MAGIYTGAHNFTGATVTGAGIAIADVGYDATVGTGGDYADIQAAITGVGGLDIKLLLISDVTEDSDVNIPNNLFLLINLLSNKLTMAAFQYTYSGVGHVTVVGNGSDTGAALAYAQTTAGKQFFESPGNGSRTTLRGFEYINTSTVSNSELVSTRFSYCSDLLLTLPNQASCGINMGSSGSYVINTRVVGGGLNCTRAITSSANCNVQNIYVSGSWSALSGYPLNISASDATISNVYLETSSASIMSLGGSVSNITNAGFGVDLTILQSGSSYTNIDLLDGDLILNGSDECSFTNVKTTGGFTLTTSTSVNNKFTNCRVTSAVSVAGLRNKFSNCEFLGGASVASTGKNNLFSGCQFGADSGGGVLTLTFDASSIGNNATNCLADAVMVDSGTQNKQDYILY